jgi:predicted methyltransferase
MTLRRNLRVGVLLAAVLLAALPAVEAQEKSVRPGINDPFKHPDIKEWIARFERESRETYDKRDEIVAACKLKPDMVVADVGAGTGLYTRLFGKAVGEKGVIYAVDIAPKFLEHIQQSSKEAGLGNVKTVLGKDTSAELPANAVDVVFICDTYHHFEFPTRMMESIHKALKPGGRVVVVDFIRIPGQSRQWVLDHVRAGQDVVEKEFAQAGFKKTEEAKGLLKENYVITFVKVDPPTPPLRKGQ